MKSSSGQTDAFERFDAWSKTYEDSFTWKHFFLPLHRTMIGVIGDVRGLAVLDVGCGTGGLIRMLLDAGASRLVGVDGSSGMLEVARARMKNSENIDLLEASAESLPLASGEFDAVVSTIAFHHFPDPTGALKEMARVLRPGGKLFLCDMCGEGVRGRLTLAYGRMKRADSFYFDLRTLSKMISEAGLSLVDARYFRVFPRVMMVTAVKD